MGKGYAIITGGSRGIGKTCAIECAAEGYDVVINYTSDRGQRAVEGVLEEIKAYGVKGIAVRANVGTFEGCKKLIDSSVEAFGPNIEILINNAGISNGKPFHEVEISQIEKTISVNLLSQLYCTRLALPYMIEQKKGWIINIASNAGIAGVEGYVDYSASKGGVITMTKALAKEVAQYNIKVNSIALGCFATDMTLDNPVENQEWVRQQTPLKKLGDLNEITILVRYLINTDFLTGQIISPNGGWTI